MKCEVCDQEEDVRAYTFGGKGHPFCPICSGLVLAGNWSALIDRIGGKESVLQEGQRIIHGDRREDYGPAKDSFAQIAAGWSVILETSVVASDVALCMAWLKLCRFLHSQDRDSLVDLAGYTGLSAMLEDIDDL